VKRLVGSLASIYVLAFVVDAWFGVVNGALLLGAHSNVLFAARTAFWLPLLFVSFILYVVLGLTSYLPRRTLVVAVLYPFVSYLVTTPIMIGLAGSLSIADIVRNDPTVAAAKAPGLLVVPLLESLVELAVAVGTLALVRRLSLGKRWTFPPEALLEADFRWRRAFLFLGGNAVLVVIGLPLYLYLTLAVGVNSFGRGFVVCHGGEISAVTRDYERDGKVVSLVAMMHIAEKGSYEKLVASIDPKGSVILAEGVADEKGLLHQKTDYKKAATALGLETQVEAFHPQEKGLDVESGDVDVQVFSPGTIGLLNGIFRVHNGTSGIGDVLGLEKQMGDPDAVEALFNDILDKRNEHLLQRIDEALVNHQRVVVPWGAYHLPGISAVLEGKGFKLVKSQEREIVRIWGRGAEEPAR
jgi:hypothetical protein